MFRLTKKADYGLIALKHIAGREAAQLKATPAGSFAVSAKEVADSYGIPLPLLSKILQKLGKAGLLISEHGINGGYRLSKHPDSISALEVIRVIDGPIILTSCFTEDLNCDHTARCPVRRPLSRIHEGILRLLQDSTIQDLLEDTGHDLHSMPVSSNLVALGSAKAEKMIGRD